MQHFHQVKRGICPLAWSQRLCGCTQASNGQAPRGQATSINNRQISIEISTHSSPQLVSASNAMQCAILGGLRPVNNVKDLSIKVSSFGHLRSISTTSTIYTSPTSTELVDATIQGTHDEGVQCFISTRNSTAHQQIPSMGLQRALSTQTFTQSTRLSSTESLNNKHRENHVESTSLENSSTKKNGIDAIDNRKSTNATETPLKKQDSPRPQPPDPETCCESGCVNCVWIRYVQELQEHVCDDKEQMEKVLDLIEDYNVKMFVKMELGL